MRLGTNVLSFAGLALDATLQSILSKLSADPSTATKQDVGNASLASIDGKLVTCNTGAVVLASSAAVIGHVICDSGSTTAVTSLPAIPSGSNTIGAVTGPSAAPLALDATLTGGAQKAITRGGAKGATTAADVTTTTIDADHQALDVAVKEALPAGSNTVGKVDQGAGGASAWKVDGSAVTQPISAASLPLPSGASTAANQATEIAGLTSIDAGVASVLTKLSSDPATQTTLAAILAKLIAAPATEAKQDTGNGFLSTLAGVVSAGKALVTETSAAAILAKLTADPSTATLQTTINANLTSLRGQITAALGQAARAASLGVTLSTEDAAKVPSLGQALAAGSTPVVLPAAQASALAQESGGNLASAATSTATTATNTTTLAGAVLATDTALSGGVVEMGGVGKDTAPTSVSDGRSVRAWLTRFGAAMVGVLGANGTALASSSNGVPVVAQTSSTWDVSDRAARLLGALTGINGSGVATGANPVPVQLSDGSAVFTGAKASTQTDGTQVTIAKGAAATGAAVSGNPVYVGGKDGSGNAQPLLVSAAGNVQTSAAKGTSVSSSAAEASHVISASACLVARASMYNGNAATRYMMLFNATSLPGNGAVPTSVIIIGTTQTQVSTFPIPTDRFSTGCVISNSSTGGTLTVGGSDALFTVDLFPANT